MAEAKKGNMVNLMDIILPKVEVVNAPNTGNLSPANYGCGSWREYWEQRKWKRFLFHHDKLVRDGQNGLKNIPQYICPACGQSFSWNGEAPDCFDGCHVNIVGDTSKKLYITPFCHACNKKDVKADVRKFYLILAP